MNACASRVASTSNWLVTSTYAYVAFVASTRLVVGAVRWGAALIAASVAYVLVMLSLAAFWTHDPVNSATSCAGGMAVAVMCGSWAATTILLPDHRRAGAWTCIILGGIYPVLLAASAPHGAPVRAMQLLYVIAAVAGGVVALWTLPVSRLVVRPMAAHA